MSSNPKVHYLVKSPPPVPVLSQITHAILFLGRSMFILYTHMRPGVPNGLFPSGFPTKTLYARSLSFTRATCSVQLIPAAHEISSRPYCLCCVR